MRLENLDVRLAVENSNVSYKDIAKKLNISNVYISRLMTHPLSQANRLRILDALGELKKERESNGSKDR